MVETGREPVAAERSVRHHRRAVRRCRAAPPHTSDRRGGLEMAAQETRPQPRAPRTVPMAVRHVARHPDTADHIATRPGWRAIRAACPRHPAAPARPRGRSGFRTMPRRREPRSRADPGAPFPRAASYSDRSNSLRPRSSAKAAHSITAPLCILERFGALRCAGSACPAPASGARHPAVSRRTTKETDTPMHIAGSCQRRQRPKSEIEDQPNAVCPSRSLTPASGRRANTSLPSAPTATCSVRESLRCGGACVGGRHACGMGAADAVETCHQHRPAIEIPQPMFSPAFPSPSRSVGRPEKPLLAVEWHRHHRGIHDRDKLPFGSMVTPMASSRSRPM